MRFGGDERRSEDDRIAEEVPIALRYNGQPFAVMLATPCDIEDFALGFSLSEGLIEAPPQLLGCEIRPLLEGIEVDLRVAEDAPAARLGEASGRLLPGRSGCGLCGARALEDALRLPRPVHTTRRFTLAALRRALGALPSLQPLNAATGAVHAAAWADGAGAIGLLREDIGRHNAVDKLIGALSLSDLPIHEGMLLVTSRASYEIVLKAASAGVGLLAALSAPTALAVDLAERAGLCLVGFARAETCNIYAHAERLLGD
nr:formate dehydrogenase accessory sulfurtransferase FdhD [Lysobacter sp. CAU 1642]